MSSSAVVYTETGSNCSNNGVQSNGKLTGGYSVSGFSESEGHPVGVYLAGEQIAQPGHFQAGGYPASLSASWEAEMLLTFSGGAIRCNPGTLEGSMAGSSNDVAVGGSLGTCGVFGVHPHLEANGCKFSVHAVSSGSGTLGIGCPAGKAITLTPAGFGCEWQIPAQAGLGEVTLTNSGSGTSRKVGAAISTFGLAYTEVGGTCSSPGSHTNGRLSGTLVFSAPGKGVWTS